MSLYGTRDAAMNWQEEVAREMQKWGFQRGRYNPCLYYHKQSGVMALVHGDDVMRKLGIVKMRHTNHILGYKPFTWKPEEQRFTIL